MNNNKRIAKNTIFLYMRMLLLMLISLYTSRITLHVLGTDDYGTYNVVAGIVVLFTFFNSALTAGVQRYLNFYIGEEDTEDVKKIFSQSLRVYIIISLIIIAISETVGILLLENYMNIPVDRMQAARIVYQLSIIATIISILRIPFNATIIAYEHMSFFAFMGIIEAILKVATVFILQYVGVDKLILYALIQILISLIIFIIYWMYCKKKFDIVNFKKYNDKTLLRGMLTFSGWNVLGSAAGTFSNQGLTIIVNHYYGVAANAAIGVANQANNAIYQFLSNFQTAFNPQIVKSYARKENDYLEDFIFKTSKYSYFLLYFIIQPFLINLDYILKLWLKQPPEGSGIFVILLCIFTLIDALAGPLWMLVEAEGDIKLYQIAGAIIGVVDLIIAYVLYACGMPAYIGFVIRDLGNLFFNFWRLWYLKKRVNFHVKDYCKAVYGKVVPITILGLMPTYFLRKVMNDSFFSFIIVCLFSCMILLALYIFIGMTNSEKKSIFEVVKNKVKSHEN